MTSTRAPRRGRPPKISAERIIEMVRAQPDMSWTMAQVAAALGVTEPALYYHYPSKHALLQAVGDAAIAEIDMPVCDGGWPAWLRVLATRIFEMATRYPQLAVPDPSLSLGSGSGGLQLAEEMLATLVRSGFSVEQATTAIALVMNTAVQFARMPEAVTSPVQVQLLEDADNAHAPLLKELYESRATWEPLRQLHNAIDVIVLGLTAQLAAQP